MAESVQFWLDNKMSTGIKVAAIGGQVLVVYREKFYVVEKDAALTKSGKPLRYSKSSMPAIWKKALRGETLDLDTTVISAADALPTATTTKRERVSAKLPKSSGNISAQLPESELSVARLSPAVEVKLLKRTKKTNSNPVTQSSVTTICPHCNFRHQLPLEKGKNGKPFFIACEKFKSEFAVRFVQVIAYQAQVAGFR